MITKEPSNKSAFKFNRFFTKSARSAFLHILRKERDAGRTLLLPAYIGLNAYEGSGVFDVVQISRIPYEFYEVDHQLAPVMNSLPKEVEKPYLLLLIHYFGIAPYNFQQILDYCQQGNRKLVEDCAHTLNGPSGHQALGTFGDYAFHSIHKVIPTTDGGLLIDNTGQSNFNVDASEEGIMTDTIEQFCNSDFEQIAEKRRLNYLYWLGVFPSHPDLLPIYSKLEDGIVPLNFPIRVLKNLRENLYFHLMDQDAPTCALYYKMIPQIDPKAFPVSYEICSQILNLPTHQDTSTEDIDRIVKLIQTFFENQQ
jgi:hypothetical protein